MGTLERLFRASLNTESRSWKLWLPIFIRQCSKVGKVKREARPRGWDVAVSSFMEALKKASTDARMLFTQPFPSNCGGSWCSPKGREGPLSTTAGGRGGGGTHLRTVSPGLPSPKAQIPVSSTSALLHLLSTVTSKWVVAMLNLCIQ